MSRPIAYNLPAAAINGSITNEDAVISYVVDGRGNDYFNNYESCTWVPSADGAAPIVFVTDTFTRGYEGNPNLAVPLFFACAGTSSAAILYTANRLPGSPGNYTNANTAIEDLNKTYSYFILESNDPFQGINATDLAFDVDASKMTSYPQTANNWYDLSGNGNTGALTNGPTWNSNGYFTFDATDDYVNFPNNTVLNSNNITVCSTFNPAATSQNGFLFEKGYVNTQYALFFEGSSFKLRFRFNNIGQQDFQVTGGTYMTAGRWYNAIVTYDGTAKMYINGTNVLTTAYNDTISVNNNGERIGAWYNGSIAGYHFNGSIASTQVYPRALTEAQVKQNYFGSPIVTDGLVFAVDANNIVSYPKSGTAWYQLTGSVGNGTLTNGPTFKANNGGVISLDGTDDFVDFGSVNFQTSNNITLDMWVYPQSATQEAYADIFDANHSANGFVLQQDYLTYNYYYFAYWDGSGFQVTSNILIEPYVWSHIVITKEGNNGKIYKNGQLVVSNTFTNPSIQGTNTLHLGKYIAGGRQWKGEYGNFKGYNKALTSAEVQQNYQAEQYRFETPAGPVTNGLVLYWDAGNLDSYPGTGTTIYDLSGNGNNGILINGVGYNQTNGGVLVFDGVDDYVDVSSPNLSATNNTVMGASRYSGGVRGRMINAANNNWLMGNWGATTENYYAVGWVSTPGSGPSDTNWRIYSALGDVSGDSYSLYVNNSLSAGPSNGGSAGPNGILINSLGEPSTGNFSFVLVYNRLLTVAEMTQNYNYFKGRFGL